MVFVSDDEDEQGCHGRNGLLDDMICLCPRKKTCILCVDVPVHGSNLLTVGPLSVEAKRKGFLTGSSIAKIDTSYRSISNGSLIPGVVLYGSYKANLLQGERIFEYDDMKERRKLLAGGRVINDHHPAQTMLNSKIAMTNLNSPLLI